jgi:hypothetical protein
MKGGMIMFKLICLKCNNEVMLTMGKDDEDIKVNLENRWDQKEINDIQIGTNYGILDITCCKCGNQLFE